MMDIDTCATNFVDCLAFPSLIAWAELLKIDHFDIMGDPLDDDLPDQEDNLRVVVAEAMLAVGKKPKAFEGKEINPMPLGGE